MICIPVIDVELSTSYKLVYISLLSLWLDFCIHHETALIPGKSVDICYHWNS